MAKKAMDKLITRKEAASILGISVKTLDAARTDGLISYVQYVENGCVYFKEVGIQEYIAKCTHRAKPMERTTTYCKPRSFRRWKSTSLSMDDESAIMKATTGLEVMIWRQEEWCFPIMVMWNVMQMEVWQESKNSILGEKTKKKIKSWFQL